MSDKTKRLAYVPAEHEAHEGTLLLWPYRNDLWRMNAKPIQETFIQLADLMAQYEDVHLGVFPGMKSAVSQRIPEKVKIFEVKYDDIWVRDTCPCIFFRNGKRFAVDWVFNAWGGYHKGLCPSWDMDDALGSEISNYFGFSRIEASIASENGGMHFDGLGTLYTTSDCILNRNRNPGFDQERMFTYLKTLLPLEKIVWLEQGLVNDETDGHIDNLCAIAKPGEIILSWTDDPFNIQYEVCRKAYEVLTTETDAKDQLPIIHKVLLPSIEKRTASECESMGLLHNTAKRYVGEVLLGSYINFSYLNGAIILPVFDCEEDAEAIRTFKKVFPDREIIPFNSREIILGGGNVHCASHHIPRIL